MINQKDFDFTGQRILITGAAGGIGLAIAKIFSCHGAELILADIKTDELKKQVKTLGDNISLHHYDQSDASSIKKLATTVRSVDIFCNNAGMIKAGLFLNQSPETIQEIISVNLIGPILLARYIGEKMVKRGSGVIVNTVSQLAFHGSATRAAYAAAKAGMVQFTKSVAVEWSAHGVRVVALAPGRTLTPMTAPFLSTDEERSKGLKQIPAGRFGSSQEMAKLTLFLASDAASYIVGETLIADGGYILS